MTKKNVKSIIVKLKNEVVRVIGANLPGKSTKRVWFIRRGLC